MHTDCRLLMSTRSTNTAEHFSKKQTIQNSHRICFAYINRLETFTVWGTLKISLDHQIFAAIWAPTVKLNFQLNRRSLSRDRRLTIDTHE